MAYIVSATQTATASAATYTVTLGAHVSGDLLLVCLSQDGGGTAIAPDATSTTAGWAMIGTGAASQGCRGQWAYLIADSASEVNPVFTGANDDWIGTCVVVRDAHATNPFGATPTSGTDFVKADWGNSTNINYGDSGALTSAVDECLLIYSWCSDGNLQYTRCKLNDLTAVDKFSTTQISHIIGYKQQQTAAAAPTVRMYSPLATEGGTGWLLAIRNKSGGALQPDIRPDVMELKWHGTWETQHDGITWQAPNNFAATINSITCSSTAPTVTYATTSAQTPWGNSSTLASTENTAGSWVGGTFTISSTDMTGKVFGLQYAISLASANAIAGAEGVLIGFSDGTNWVVYQAISKSKAWLALNEETAFIALGNATAYASSGSINWGAVTRVGYFIHRANSVTTSAAIYVRNAALFGTTALTGGGSSRPATFNDYQAAMNSWGTWKWAEIQGSAQIKPKTSVQIGDGTNVTYFDGATGSLGFPQAWSATSVNNWQMDWNVAAGQVGLYVKASASDTIKLAAGAATSDNAQLLTIDATSSTSATYDFAQAFGGFSPTLKTGVAVVGATFTGCGEIAAKGASLTNVIIKNTTSTDATLAYDANGATVTGSISCVKSDGTVSAYHLELGTAVTAITLTDVTFTGTPGTDKVHVLKTSGTVTITISGTTSLVAGDVTTAGATVVIAAPSPTLDATVLSGSRVVLYNDTTAAELDNTAPAGTSWSKVITSGASSGDTLTLHVFKEGYEEFSTSFIYAGIDNTLLVSQSVHAAIASLRTELGITDYTTITEFSLDITGTVEIDADDADGNTTKARLAIWYNGVLTTENGARYLRGAISVLSTAAIRINTSVLDLKIENISVTYGLNFTDTDRRLYRSDGTPIYAAASAAGSIQNDYSGVPDTVTTSDQSLNLATAEQAIDNKLSSISSGVWAYVVTGSTTAVQMMRGFAAMLLGKVSGAGTGAETFRDIADTKDVATFMVDSSGNRSAVTRDLT